MSSIETNQQILSNLVAIIIIGATSFEIHHAIFFRKWYKLKSSEIFTFLLLIAIGTVASYYLNYNDITYSLFNTVSAASTTGFGFDL